MSSSVLSAVLPIFTYAVGPSFRQRVLYGLSLGHVLHFTFLYSMIQRPLKCSMVFYLRGWSMWLGLEALCSMIGSLAVSVHVKSMEL